MRDRPIGVFDSGLGGLTAVREIIKVMPEEDIIYFGDTGRVPYGSKSRETIIRYALQDINFLKSLKVKTIVAACGTVSSALTGYKAHAPFIGVLFPTCSAAVKATKNKKICVIGTSATVRSGAYRKQINDIDSSIIVYQADCPLFAPMIESGFVSRDDKIVKEVVRHYIEPVRKFNADTLILGCTHYPIIREAISDVIGYNVNIIDSGKETARFVRRRLESGNLFTLRKSEGTREFYVSDSVEEFCSTARIFLGMDISSGVRKIDINAFQKGEV